MAEWPFPLTTPFFRLFLLISQTTLFYSLSPHSHISLLLPPSPFLSLPPLLSSFFITQPPMSDDCYWQTRSDVPAHALLWPPASSSSRFQLWLMSNEGEIESWSSTIFQCFWLIQKRQPSIPLTKTFKILPVSTVVGCRREIMNNNLEFCVIFGEHFEI